MVKRVYIIGLIGAIVLIVTGILVLIPQRGRQLDTNQAKKIESQPAAVAPVQPPMLEEAEKLFSQGRLLEAKPLYYKAMESESDVNELKRLQTKIEEINITILFSPRLDECSLIYEVKPKDTLSKIAQEFHTTVNLIKRANNVSSDMIRIGQKLKVNTCAFAIVVDKSQNLLFLKRKGEVIRTYLVSTGKDNSTPVGTFKIINKLINPTWYKTGAVIPPDSPDNILGSRWMGFDLQGFGIHGTTEPDKLGQQVTLGCVRMKNEEVEELFDIVPVGTEVTVVD